jgi:hypothetical protein
MVTQVHTAGGDPLPKHTSPGVGVLVVKTFQVLPPVPITLKPLVPIDFLLPPLSEPFTTTSQSVKREDEQQ